MTIVDTHYDAVNDVYIEIIDTMPSGIHSQYRENDDGSYNVFLRFSDSAERQMQAYKHELEHIKNDDLHNEGSVQIIEMKAHGLSSMQDVTHLIVPNKAKNPIAPDVFEWLKFRKRMIRQIKKRREEIKYELQELESFDTRNERQVMDGNEEKRLYDF